MITQKSILPAESYRELPGCHPEPSVSFSVPVKFLGVESFIVELDGAEGGNSDYQEECPWEYDPSWAGRQPWPGLEADE